LERYALGTFDVPQGSMAVITTNKVETRFSKASVPISNGRAQRTESKISGYQRATSVRGRSWIVGRDAMTGSNPLERDLQPILAP
jgi:hypothetical protein